MAKERYRLQALLTIKENEKKRAERALAEAVGILNKARKREEELISEKKEIKKKWLDVRDEMKHEMDRGSAVGKGNRFVNCMRDLKDREEEKQKEIDEQREKVAEAAEALREKRREYIDACKEVKVMLKHKELWIKKIKDELSKKEEREMDELGNIIHELKKWHDRQKGKNV
jgi:hypothetical protein